jgi:hypothetical protein
MLVRTALPEYDLYGLLTRPGDVLGRTKPGSLIEHRWLLCFDWQIAHTAGPGDIFRSGTIDEVLKDGGSLRLVHPTASLDETFARLFHANRLVGINWWNMNCIQTTDFIVREARTRP